jgi:CTP:molybdopterin cytidylyltransferase MocA
VELEQSFPALLAEESRWPLKLRNRARHHLGEVRRVALATQTLESLQNVNDSHSTFAAMQSIGKLLDESHASLRDLYEVSIPEVDKLVEIIRDNTHVLGTRLMGGGFGGNVLALTTREHTQSLIQKVQEQYYAPRDRHGVREGSVMVSTPGPGLAHVDPNYLLREAIARINSIGASAAGYTTSLIDASTLSPEPQEIWPVIVAAGKGTRAAETGLTVPKPVAMVNDLPAIVHVVRNIRAGLGRTLPPVVIVSPETKPVIREALHGENVIFVTQSEAYGTGNAVLRAHSILEHFHGMTLIVWGTQPVIRPRTFTRIAKLAELFPAYDMVLPTVFVEHPYAPIRRNESGEIESAKETHLESAQTVAFGESNISLFLVRNQPLFEVLVDLHNRYWNDSSQRYERSRGELGFPNEVISELSKRRFGVFASPFADRREEQGIKRFEDVARCERLIAELEQHDDGSV